MKRIAVLSSNFAATLMWMERFSSLNIKEINIGNRTAKDHEGNVYLVVTEPEQVRGYLFTDYIKAPDYFTLEDVVKSQIR
jgi:hypothetical protein